MAKRSSLATAPSASRQEIQYVPVPMPVPVRRGKGGSIRRADDADGSKPSRLERARGAVKTGVVRARDNAAPTGVAVAAAGVTALAGGVATLAGAPPAVVAGTLMVIGGGLAMFAEPKSKTQAAGMGAVATGTCLAVLAALHHVVTKRQAAKEKEAQEKAAREQAATQVTQAPAAGVKPNGVRHGAPATP